MKAEKMCKNEVRLVGTISSNVVLDHETKHGKMYKFMISVSRTSGVIDELPVIITEKMFESEIDNLEVGKLCTILGEYRSYSFDHHVRLLVLAKQIYNYDDDKINNEAAFVGYIAKSNQTRTTPKGKKIKDIIVAVNHSFGRTAYIPCVVWNDERYDKKATEVGSRVSVVGRIQSREYTKRYGDDTVENKIAYEVSISNIKLDEEKEEEAVI